MRLCILKRRTGCKRTEQVDVRLYYDDWQLLCWCPPVVVTARRKSKHFSMPSTTSAIITSFRFFFIFWTEASLLAAASSSVCLEFYVRRALNLK